MIDHVWRGTVSCEGGPLLVTDGYADWAGAEFTADGELDPAGDLGRATAALYPDDDEVDAALVTFGPSTGTGLVWEMDGPGSAHVATTPDGLVAVRSWVRGSDSPRRHVESPAARAEEHALLTLALADRVTLSWAVIPAADVVTAPPRLDTAEFVGIGLVVEVVPGTYTVSCGWHDGDRYAPGPGPAGDGDWSCRWIRLTRG